MTRSLLLLRRLTAVCLAFGATEALANIPPGLTSFQGVLRDTSELPLSGTYSIVFRYWSDASSVDAALYEVGWETHAAVSVSDGLFTVLLGSQPFNNGASGYGGLNIIQMFGDFEQVFLQLEVDGDVLLPRIRFAAAPYAFNCTQLQDRSPGEFLRSEGSDNFTGSDLYGYRMTFDAPTTLDVNGKAYFNGEIHVSEFDTAPLNQYLYFHHDGSEEGAYISFDVGSNLFQTSQGEGMSIVGLTRVVNGLIVRDAIRTGDQSHTTSPYNRLNAFGSVAAPSSGVIGDPGDLYVENQLEVDGTAYLNGSLSLDDNGPESDQTVQFFEDGLAGGESIRWADLNDRFEISDDLLVTGTLHLGPPTEAPVGYNRIASASGTPDSGDVTARGDLYVEFDLEVDSQLFLNGEIRMDDDGPDHTQSIYFFDDAVASNESISWADAEDRFELTNDLALGGLLRVGSTTAAPVSYSTIGAGLPVYASGASDLMVSGNLEVGGTLALNGLVYMKFGGLDSNQQICFYEGASCGRSLLWDNGQNRFEMDDSLKLTGAIELNNTIEMDDDGPDQTQRIYFWEAGVLNGESFGWTDPNDRFEFTDSVHVAGDLSATGAKPFVQNHPTRPDLSVVYAALEGDEVATYTRGSARLVNGVAHVALGETFAWVTSPDLGLTAHLTARSPGAQLYVESISTSELRVASDPGTAPDAEFDYIVYGLRVGFESWDVVRPRSGDAPIPSAESMQQRYLAHPELRAYAPDSRFARTAAALGRSAEPTAASTTLRTAIGEYDPDADVGGIQPTPPVPTPPASIETTTAKEPASELATETTLDHGYRHYIVLEPVEAGDVLVADLAQPDRLRRARSLADPGVVGVAVGTLGTQYPAASAIPVAESGIVTCRVDASAGAILRGDLLVSGLEPGTAMRQTAPIAGTVLGKALKAHASGVGWIEVLISPR